MFFLYCSLTVPATQQCVKITNSTIRRKTFMLNSSTGEDAGVGDVAGDEASGGDIEGGVEDVDP